MSNKEKEAPKKDVRSKKVTVRQYCYINKKHDESFVISLERTFKQEEKEIFEWDEIASKKGITF